MTEIFALCLSYVLAHSATWYAQLVINIEVTANYAIVNYRVISEEQTSTDMFRALPKFASVIRLK